MTNIENVLIDFICGKIYDFIYIPDPIEQKNYKKAYIKAYGKVYRQTETFKAAQRLWQRSDIGRASRRRYYLNLKLANKTASIRTLTAWAIQVKKLHPRCDWCLTVDDLEAHHVKEKFLYPELALDINNGQTLCKKHHDDIHRMLDLERGR